MPGDLASGGLRHPRARHGRDAVRHAGMGEEVDRHAVGAWSPMMSYDAQTDSTAVAWRNSQYSGGRSARILIISGDLANAGVFVDYLGRHGFRVASAPTLQGGLRVLAAREPDLVILDLHGGQSNGLQTLCAIRSQSSVPMIVITGDRSDEVDCVLCLELGADDCVTKLIGQCEFVARIRAVLRRRLTDRPARGEDKDHRRSRFGGWVLDRRLRTLTDPAGSPVGLANGDYALLVAFLDAPRRPLSREYLLQATRMHEDIFDRSIDVKVLRLRRRLEQNPGAPRLIRTERGVGYVFTLPVEHLG
ncbi:MAG: winged helix-turn-helix domain-containing protein [Inquilinus sp.]|uniref:winged helix-turn-helix domain-containing protein n=1 Tax=Inquilinus sp. TaxID=1932117 RepID=UPI003F32A6FB